LKIFAKKIIDERNDYKLLYDFLTNNNYHIENIYVSEMPVGEYMYLDNKDLKTKSFKTKSFKTKSFKTEYYYTDKDLRVHMRLSDRVFIYPYEDQDLKHGFNLFNYKYSDILRIWIDGDDEYLFNNLRRAKIKRLKDD